MKPTPPQLPAALIGIYPGVRVIVSEKLWWATQTVSWHAYPYDVPGELPYVVRCGDFKLFGSLSLDDMSIPLDSPVAMCHAARWLAEQMGMDPGATAPGWAQYTCGEHCCNGETGEMAACTRPVWSLGTDEGFVLFMDCPNPEAWDGEECRHVPGISALTDPAAALAAACLAVGGAS